MAPLRLAAFVSSRTDFYFLPRFSPSLLNVPVPRQEHRSALPKLTPQPKKPAMVAQSLLSELVVLRVRCALARFGY
eukprot:12895383-Prorocentrum_lima.AAC.1